MSFENDIVELDIPYGNHAIIFIRMVEGANVLLYLVSKQAFFTLLIAGKINSRGHKTLKWEMLFLEQIVDHLPLRHGGWVHMRSVIY